MRIIKTTTSSLRHAQVVVCVGCCCGRVDRGRSEVPINELKSLWKNYGLRKKVQLTISGCLGPCDMQNVALLMSDRGQIWLGNLRERAEFEALAESSHIFLICLGPIPQQPPIMSTSSSFHSLTKSKYFSGVNSWRVFLI